MEVFVSAVPPASGRWQVSTRGGSQPRWRRDGRELFYMAPDGTVMSVDIDGSRPMIRIGTPRALFHTTVAVDPLLDQYAVSADGQRFLVNVPFDSPEQTSINVILNWPAMLTKQAAQ
jgi:hypothetical protein